MPSPLETALAAARAGGAILLANANAPLEIEEKGRRADLVTQADRASERAIVQILRDAYPSAAILGEEGGTYEGDARERWIVDPLDGTTNYAHGYPFYCVSIGYERAGEILAGVIYAPAMNECFEAERGSGARRNGESIGVSTIETLSSALLVTGFKPYDFATNAPYFARASELAQAVRRDGSAALDLAYTAMGRFDGFWEYDLAPWDTAAGSLLVREAGGCVTDASGAAFSVSGKSIVATNARIHGELVAMLG